MQASGKVLAIVASVTCSSSIHGDAGKSRLTIALLASPVPAVRLVLRRDKGQSNFHMHSFAKPIESPDIYIDQGDQLS